MATKRSLVSLTIATALVLVATGCGSDKADALPTGTSTSSAPPPTSTPMSSPPATSSAPPAATTRTKAELTKALLALPDLPTGISIDPKASYNDDGELSSTDPRCKDLVLLFNAEPPPGTTAFAYHGYTGGPQGPDFDEELDAMGSPAAATALLNRTRAAFRSCKQAKLTIDDIGSSVMSISEISVPQAGTNPVGGRFAASSGRLAGLEVNFAFAAVGDVVIAMIFMAGDQAESMLVDAVAKATTVLGTAKTGT